MQKRIENEVMKDAVIGSNNTYEDKSLDIFNINYKTRAIKAVMDRCKHTR